MRRRDLRAIIFCVVTTLALAIISYALFRGFFVTLALVTGYVIWLLTRPRMVRLMRRARGEPDWGGYFKNE